MNPCNAIIKSFQLGIDPDYTDHGDPLMTIKLHLKIQGGGEVTFPVYCTTSRTGENILGQSLYRILSIAGCRTTDQLVGRPVRAKFFRDGSLSDIIIGVGHFLDDDWFVPREDPMFAEE